MLAVGFGDNDAPVAPIGVDGSEVSLVVRVPQVDVIPDRMPTITDAGNMSLAEDVQGADQRLVPHLVAGHVLASVKEAFAIAPGSRSARVVVVRDDVGDPRCARRPRCRSSAAGSPGHALARVYWETVEAWDVLIEISTDTLMALRGSAKELKPLDLDHEPDLQRVVDAFTAERG